MSRGLPAAVAGNPRDISYNLDMHKKSAKDGQCLVVTNVYIILIHFTSKFFFVSCFDFELNNLAQTFEITYHKHSSFSGSV